MPEADKEFLDLAMSEARGRKGKLRTLFRDLTTAKGLAESKGQVMNYDHFADAVAFREEKGAWTEDY